MERALLLGARMVMPLVPAVLLHQDTPARAPQFTNWRTLWNWLRFLQGRRETRFRNVLK